MISLDYAKLVENGYVLNFYADSYDEVEKFDTSKKFLTYGVPLPGSIITVVEHGIKTNYQIQEDGSIVELPSESGGGSFPTLEDLDISKFNTTPADDPYFIENTNYIGHYITRDGKYKFYQGDYSTSIQRFDVINNSLINIETGSTGWLSPIKNLQPNELKKIIYENKTGNIIFIGNTTANKTGIIKNNEEFIVIDAKDGCKDFVEDGNGNVYYHGTTSGISKYDVVAGTVKQISTTDGITKCDSNGNIYVYNTTTKVTSKIVDDALVEISATDKIDSDFDIIEDGVGFVYAIAGQKIIYKIEDTITKLHTCANMGGNALYEYYVLGNDGYVYVGGGNRSSAPDSVFMYNGAVGNVSGLDSTTKDCFVVNIGDGFVYMGGKSDNGSGIYMVKNGVATIIDGTKGAMTNQVLGTITSNDNIQYILVYSDFSNEGKYAAFKIRDGKLVTIVNIDGEENKGNFNSSNNIREDEDKFVLWQHYINDAVFQDIPYFTNNNQNIIPAPALFILPDDEIKVIYKSGKIEILNLYNPK